MRYSIITPTICRPSLIRLCQSIDVQTQSDWEHLVIIDVPSNEMTQDQRKIVASIAHDGKRTILNCSTRHKNYGHTCRHMAWEHVKGDYIFYVDDDDYLADRDVLRVLDSVTEPWAIFPVLRHGERFFNVPPGLQRTGTGMFIHRREIGRWPDSDSYEADGSFVEELKQNYAFQVLDSGPLIVQPKSSYGISNAETWLGDRHAKIIEVWRRNCIRGRVALSMLREWTRTKEDDRSLTK